MANNIHCLSETKMQINVTTGKKNPAFVFGLLSVVWVKVKALYSSFLGIHARNQPLVVHHKPCTIFQWPYL